MTPFFPMNRSAIAAIALALASTGCGGGGGGDGATGILTLSITDAAVDGATAVVVEFTGVELKPAGGGRVVFDFDSPRQIDLLALQGGASEPLLDGVEVPAGNYSWIRLAVNAERNVLDSYVELDGGARVSLFIPSGAETGLKLHSGFTVAQGGFADFTIDFDLRKSVHDPVGQPDFYLRPALRLVDNLEVGSVSGIVSSELVTDASCTNGVEHDIGNAVYLFAGAGAVVDDEGSPNAPLASAVVTLDPVTQEYRYAIGFVATGSYTVAFTCQAADDDPVTDDTITFVGAADVDVTAGADTVHAF